MVIYKSTASSITLYDVAEHDNFEGKHQRALADFVAGADVQPIDAPVTATVTLTPDQHKAFADLLAFMAEQDRDILDLAVKGDFAGLKEFVALIPLPWAALEATHGGRTGMRKYIKSIL